MTRGTRNNNPGNIRHNERNRWVGLVGPDDGGYCVFDTPVNGIRAMAVLLQSYYDRYGCDTVEKIIGRWAPPEENSTGNYTQFVAKRIGIAPTGLIGLHDYLAMRPLVEAIITFENGQQPYTRAQIDAGLARAGLVPDADKPLGKSRTITGAKVATAATTAGLGLEGVRQVADYAMDFAPLIRIALSYGPWLIGALALAGIGYVVYARWDDRRKGLR